VGGWSGTIALFTDEPPGENLISVVLSPFLVMKFREAIVPIVPAI
jgi:hypothetical protein